MVADDDRAPEFPGRFVVRDDTAEIKRGPRFYPVFAGGRGRKRNPIGASLHAQGFVVCERKGRARRGKNRLDGVFPPLLHIAGLHHDADFNDGLPPCLVVLHEDPRLLREGYGKPWDAIRLKKLHGLYRASKEMRIWRNSRVDLNQLFPYAYAACTPCLGNSGTDADLLQRAVAVGSRAPIGLDAAVASLAE